MGELAELRTMRCEDPLQDRAFATQPVNCTPQNFKAEYL